MKRHLELMRSILFQCEAHKHGYAPKTFDIEGYTDEQVGFHILLLGEAGLLTVRNITSLGSKSPRAVPLYLTQHGYDFLDSIRDQTVWEETQGVLAKAGGWTLDLVHKVATAILTKQAMAAIGSA